MNEKRFQLPALSRCLPGNSALQISTYPQAWALFESRPGSRNELVNQHETLRSWAPSQPPRTSFFLSFLFLFFCFLLIFLSVSLPFFSFISIFLWFFLSVNASSTLFLWPLTLVSVAHMALLPASTCLTLPATPQLPEDSSSAFSQLLAQWAMAASFISPSVVLKFQHASQLPRLLGSDPITSDSVSPGWEENLHF